MAGHSKWANIKHRKSAQDARRAKAFTRVAREIMVAARTGGGDPSANPRLRAAIAAARGVNMPNDKIEKAIKKGLGETEAAAFEEVFYEGYGPNGVAIFVSALTDNRNRTTSAIRHLFSKYGGELGSPNSVAWMFERKGYITVPKAGIEEEELLEKALEAGAEDVRTEDEFYEVLTSPEDFHDVRDRLEAAGVPMESAEVAMLPQNFVEVKASEAESLLNLLEALEEHDDVQKVSANCQVVESA
ncbi:MAG: YebC/PmpR family DNA-binding transcriptional regulator [Acidobacteria bacterium]|nr:MAG: YebC/PmpR family DNA-binding transcriptional regulator [Acidobacteriota bacterium]